jgi:hypothetical protein
MSPIEYPLSSVCQEHDCKNGGLCFQPPGSPEYVCKCPSGITHILKICIANIEIITFQGMMVRSVRS